MRVRFAISCVWLFAFGVCLQPGVLTAQDAGASVQREGFWWGVGAGYGFSRVGCDICTGDAAGGFSLSGRAGLTVSPSVLLGLETNGWLHPNGPTFGRSRDYGGTGVHAPN